MIILNRVETPDGTQLTSHHRHDYVEHKDENGHTYAVDGGKEYLRRVGPLDHKDLSVTTKDTFEVVREAFLWGTYGKEGAEVFKRTPLCELEDEHIQAIVDTQKHLSDEVKGLFILEQAWRASVGEAQHKSATPSEEAFERKEVWE